MSARFSRNNQCLYERNVPVPGCYCLHSPWECNIRFPVDQRPLHKCGLPAKETIFVPSDRGFRKMLLPSKEKNLYPLIVHKKDYDRLKEQAMEGVSNEETLRVAAVRAAAEAAARMEALASKQAAQPGLIIANDDLAAPDQDGHTLSRAEALRIEEMAGPRLANAIILGTKCRAIRDAQLKEKELIKKEMTEEERRLDQIMEENRLAAINRAESIDAERKERLMNNLDGVKKQIEINRNAKMLQAERIEEESVRMVRAAVAMREDEEASRQEKHRKQDELKAMLDQCAESSQQHRRLVADEERSRAARAAEFLRQRQEREAERRRQDDAKTAARLAAIEGISGTQKAEAALREENERIRRLRVQEEVEREYRRRERDKAYLRRKQHNELKEAREKQVADVHRLMAREIAKDEMEFRTLVARDEEAKRKEDERKALHEKTVEQHRLAIMEQINQKEKVRSETRFRISQERQALSLEAARSLALERRGVRDKLEELHKQKVPRQYVAQVERALAKLQLV